VPDPHLQVNELQSKMSRFHGLTAANPERKTIATIVSDGCESLKWQVRRVVQMKIRVQTVQAARQQSAQLSLWCIHCKATEPHVHLSLATASPKT
jgi:hypothetical protein